MKKSLLMRCTLHTSIDKKYSKNVYEIQIHAWTPNYSSLAWKTKKLGKRCKMCAVQCAMCTVRTLIAKNFSIRMFTKSEFSGSVRSDLTAPFKPPAQKKLKVSLKLVKNWKNCRQICFRACLPISLLKENKDSKYDDADCWTRRYLLNQRCL